MVGWFEGVIKSRELKSVFLWALLFEDAHLFEDAIWGDELCSATTVNLKRIPQVWSQELQ